MQGTSSAKQNGSDATEEYYRKNDNPWEAIEVEDRWGECEREDYRLELID